MEAVEVVVRCHLSVQKIHAYKQDTDIHTLIVDKALKAEGILYRWERIAQSNV